MDNRPIGVFDSGLGGLTAVKELQQLLPHEDIVYFGDTGRVPYGTRSPATICHYAQQDTRFLLKHGVKAVVAACGTVSATAKQVLQALPVPYVSVIEPTAAAAVLASVNKKIGVIATTATIKSGAFQEAVLGQNSSCAVYAAPCPLLVPLVESGFITPNDPITQLVLRRYLAPLQEQHIDTLILGCTHYPILESHIANELGKGVTLVNSGKETALRCAALLKQQNLLAQPHKASYQYFVSDSVAGFYEIASVFFSNQLDGSVQQIHIAEY